MHPIFPRSISERNKTPFCKIQDVPQIKKLVRIVMGTEVFEDIVCASTSQLHGSTNNLRILKNTTRNFEDSLI
jgi:hypothetical protein